MKNLGQHFLKNTVALQAIADALEVKDGETIIEIGPGHGELTAFLVRATERSGSAVISMEKDSLIAALAGLSEKEKPGLLSIIEGDALKLLPPAIAKLHRYKIVGNIPYYITGKLLRVISESEHKPERTVLLIQKEVAERICAAPPEMNRLAASVQFWAAPAIVAYVSRKDFSPPPDVDSAVIVLDAKRTSAKGAKPIDPEIYYRAVRGIFAQPRKTLLNNLTDAMDKTLKKSEASSLIRKIGIDPGGRPQDLTIENIIAIASMPIWG
jgi:16S rRNA (adenine1518-N6/adenine1519-N6)-dimethyltransferase